MQGQDIQISKKLLNNKKVENQTKGKLTLQDNCNSPSPSGAIMTALCVSFVRMCSKPLFEDYCYVNEDRLYNTE